MDRRYNNAYLPPKTEVGEVRCGVLLGSPTGTTIKINYNVANNIKGA